MCLSVFLDTTRMPGICRVPGDGACQHVGAEDQTGTSARAAGSQGHAPAASGGVLVDYRFLAAGVAPESAV